MIDNATVRIQKEDLDYLAEQIAKQVHTAKTRIVTAYDKGGPLAIARLEDGIDTEGES